jgi:hypothetical protein
MGKSQNKNLHNAKKGKNDEFYTQLSDIERELKHYKHHFKDKVVYCNCDDPRVSDFFHYFSYNFDKLGLKKLITTCYKSQSWDLFSDNSSERAIYLEYNGDKNGNKVPDPEEIGIHNLEGDGDFRSKESIELLKQADIVVTNPPFSLFREYVAQLIEYDKKFLIVGSRNAITYKEVFPLIMNNKLWLGPTITSGDREFQVPDEYPVTASGWRIDEEGKKYLRIKGVRWFTNIDHGRRHQILPLMTMADNIKFNKKFKGKKMYDKYDNFDAIEVPFTDAIPSDYEGIMGVPISFLDKYNPDQIEIIGNGQTMANELGIRPVGQKFVDDYYQQGNKGQINAKWNNLVFHIEEKVVVPYQRILIKHKKNDY